MSILKKPLITEKSTQLTDKLGQYSFLVEKSATKTEIKSAIEKMYDVNVTGLSTSIYAGKTKSRSTKKGIFNGRRASFKKAIVTLKEGQTIDFFANI
ncbi:MAG: 50S ribosomal protein L23 [Bacteroidia bacterium]|nr:50S ribosomal protein L23 [Bacteroidia bacterium]MCC7532796.1 50S ribosomal protein L23 [Bacteroidia bacterium]MCZ2141331.1 50S ribosomal protein L23 [Bacteroidia bacterium]